VEVVALHSNTERSFTEIYSILCTFFFLEGGGFVDRHMRLKLL